MATSSPTEDSYLEMFEVSATTASSIHVAWQIPVPLKPFVRGYQVHYQKIASTYIQYGPILRPSDNEYQIANLVADTYYKVCLMILRNGTAPFRKCTDASTINWQLPVSIGSSIGAVLALSMIVFIVLLSRCRFPLQYKKSKRLSKYDAISSAVHGEQFDFSETVTQGNDDEFMSEYDHDEDSFCEIPQHECKRYRQHFFEKMTVPNGLGRGHVHPHSHSFSYNQQKYSCRTQHAQPVDHGRQTRAYSIQCDDSMCFHNRTCATLTKDRRKHSAGIEDIESEDGFGYFETSNLSVTSLKESSNVENQTPTQMLCSRQPQTISFIDETPEISLSSNANSFNIVLQDTLKSENALITTQFDDESKSAIAACRTTSDSSDSIKQTELKSTSNRMIAIAESISFDEHTL